MSNPPDPLLIAALQQSVQPQGNPVPQPPAAAPPVLAGSPGSAEAQTASVRPGRPLLLDTMQKLIRPPMQAPAPGQLARPVSRLDTFENFLGNFLSAFGQGMQQSGQRGAESKGFGAAVQGPRQLTVQNQELANQTQQTQAEAAEKQAQAGLLGSQTGGQWVQGPYGPVWVPFKSTGQVAGAQFGAAGRIGAAQAAGQAHITGEQIKLMAAMGKISKIVPVMGADGRLAMRALNQFGQPIGDIDGAIPPASYLPKTSTTQEFKQLDDGSIVAIPKSTTTAPRIPGPTAKFVTPAPKGAPSGVPRQITNAQGTPLVFKGALTGTTRTMVETAPKVVDLVNRMRGQLQGLQQSGQLGPGASRWADFWSGKVGADNPQFRAFKTNADLLSTLLMRMHVGARGGEMIMKHFDDMIGVGHQSAANMAATLDQIDSYAHDVGSAGQLPANFGKSNQPNPKSGNKVLDPLGIR